MCVAHGVGRTLQGGGPPSVEVAGGAGFEFGEQTQAEIYAMRHSDDEEGDSFVCEDPSVRGYMWVFSASE